MSWSSGTNTIKEGDESKSLTLQMLEVEKQGGGTELFVRKSDVALGTKSVTQNGTYTAASDGKYGFSQFSVNVRGGNGSADSHGRPTGGDIKPGGAGSAVVGTDPETGNDVVVGVDEDGNLVNTPLPSSIVLVTPPTKTDYNDGESIDLSGAVVVAKMADGSTWTDVDHPNGHVSCSCDPTSADISQASTGNKTATSDLVDSPVHFHDGYEIPAYEYSDFTDFIKYKIVGPCVLLPDGKIATIGSYNSGYTFFDKQWRESWGQTEPTEWHPRGSPSSGTNYTYNGKTVWYYLCSTANPPQFNAEESALTGGMAWTVLYGEISGADAGVQTITLNWARPGDGKVLSTTMEITVGAHSTESSSGTGGSGGGGSF